MRSPTESRGFVLVVTLSVVSLLVVALVGLSAISRVGSGASLTGDQNLRGRRNALLALHMALAELQRTAGPDEALTGMAGLTGISAGPGHPARHWCGVWSPSGEFRRWLASGAGDNLATPDLTGSNAVVVCGPASLGADAHDKEHVRVLWEPITSPDSDGVAVADGACAWWIGDEGVKLSLVPDAATVPVAGGCHAIDELLPGLLPTEPSLAKLVAFRQLQYVGTPPLTPGALQANLHALTVNHRSVDSSGGLHSALLNVNSSSARYWRGVAATFNRLREGAMPGLDPALFGAWMEAHVADEDVAIGKAQGAPFADGPGFLDSQAVAAAVSAGGGELADFASVLGPWLTARSDTFRIRGAGRVTVPADPTRVLAEAWCEAVAQRTPAPCPGFGRHFVLISFRWLGPEDL